MKESIRQYMQVGTISFMSYPAIMKGDSPETERILKRLIEDPYFDALEISWIKDAQARARIARYLAQANMTVCYGAQPRFLTTGYNINDLDEEKRTVALNSLKEGIDEAYELGAVGLAFLSGPYQEETKEESFQALLDSTREACAYAKSKGALRIELEIFDYDVDKKSLIGPTPLAKRFAEEVRKDYDNFGLLVDLSHFPLIRESVEESILPIRDYITHAHIGNAVVLPDCDGYGDQHPRFGFPNSANGLEDAVSYLRTLLATGFLNTERPPVMSFEVKPFGDEEPDMVLNGCKRFLEKAWAQV